MSDTSQDPGWWLASDGKWYPPELWTGPPGTGPAAVPPGAPANQWPTTSSGAGTTAPTAPPPQPGYGAAQPSSTYPTAAPGPYSQAAPGPGAYQPYGYGQHLPYGVPVTRKSNGLAIASLICSCAGIFLIGLPAVLGIIFGFIARTQIRRSNGALKGDGLALAGIIVGFGVLALVIIVFAVAAGRHNDQNTGVVSLLHVSQLLNVVR
jgi:Domain of unknown function (DUF4190)